VQAISSVFQSSSAITQLPHFQQSCSELRRRLLALAPCISRLMPTTLPLDFGFPLNHPHARSIRIRSAHCRTFLDLCAARDRIFAAVPITFCVFPGMLYCTAAFSDYVRTTRDCLGAAGICSANCDPETSDQRSGVASGSPQQETP
jgi:hypothetical protein